MQHEEKCQNEMENLKVKLDREYDIMLQNFHRELEKLHQSHQQDLEKRVFFVVSFFKKITNHRQENCPKTCPHSQKI